MGCKVWAFELQQRCIEYAMNATIANHLEDSVNIFNKPVTAVHNQLITIPHSTTVCSGLFNLGRTDCPECPKFVGIENVAYMSVALDSMFPAPFIVDFLKIDVEGHEPQVLQGAEQMFKEHRINVMSLESQPKMWSKLQEREQRHESIYRRIMSYGYKFECATSKTAPVVYTLSTFKDFLTFLHTNQCVDWNVSV